MFISKEIFGGCKKHRKIMKVEQNITGEVFTFFTGIFKEGGKEIYRKSICIVLYKRMILINLWKLE